MRSKVDSFLVWTDRHWRASLTVKVDPNRTPCEQSLLGLSASSGEH
jgi:hypothetical protein